jgi:CheY-like chemotaxis protein
VIQQLSKEAKVKDTLVSLYVDPNSQHATPLAAGLEKSRSLATSRKQVKVKNTFPTILYAEHSALRRLRLAADLERAGFLVRTAECAIDALELTASCAFDVMILDYELLDMTGAQLAQEIRALEPGAQILLLSRRSHLPAGELVYVDFHAVKGLPLDALIEIVKNLLETPTHSLQSAAYCNNGTSGVCRSRAPSTFPYSRTE